MEQCIILVTFCEYFYKNTILWHSNYSNFVKLIKSLPRVWSNWLPWAKVNFVYSFVAPPHVLKEYYFDRNLSFKEVRKLLFWRKSVKDLPAKGYREVWMRYQVSAVCGMFFRYKYFYCFDQFRHALRKRLPCMVHCGFFYKKIHAIP